MSRRSGYRGGGEGGGIPDDALNLNRVESGGPTKVHPIPSSYKKRELTDLVGFSSGGPDRFGLTTRQNCWRKITFTVSLPTWWSLNGVRVPTGGFLISNCAGCGNIEGKIKKECICLPEDEEREDSEWEYPDGVPGLDSDWDSCTTYEKVFWDFQYPGCDGCEPDFEIPWPYFCVVFWSPVNHPKFPLGHDTPGNLLEMIHTSLDNRAMRDYENIKGLNLNCYPPIQA